MAYSNLELEFQFKDRTTKKFVMGPFATNAAAISAAKANIKAFNATYTTQYDQQGEIDWENFVVNENGETLMMGQGLQYPDVPIVNATIVTTNEIDVMRGGE